MSKLKYAITACALLALLTACAPRMDDEDYVLITEEYTEEVANYMLVTEDLQFDEEFETYLEEKLSEVALRHGYTAEQYLEEAEARGEDWSTIISRIEQRYDELQEEQMEDIDIEEQIEEYEEEVEPDPEYDVPPVPDAEM